MDGAHAADQVDLSFLDTLKPDFMASNLHKWLFVPKSCAMFYVNPKHRNMIQTLPISWSYGTRPIELPSNSQEVQHNEHLLVNKFCFVGTTTYAQMLSVSEALKFRAEICGGEDNIRKYQYDLQEEAIEQVKAIFGPGSELLQNSTNSLVPPGLFNISLPLVEKYSAVHQNLQGDFGYFRTFKHKCDEQIIIKK